MTLAKGNVRFATLPAKAGQHLLERFARGPRGIFVLRLGLAKAGRTLLTHVGRES